MQNHRSHPGLAKQWQGVLEQKEGLGAGCLRTGGRARAQQSGLRPRARAPGSWDELDSLGTTWSVQRPGLRAGGRDCRELSQPVDWRLGEKAEVRLISGSPALVSLGLWKGKGILSSLSRDRVAHRMGLWCGGEWGPQKLRSSTLFSQPPAPVPGEACQPRSSCARPLGPPDDTGTLS